MVGNAITNAATTVYATSPASQAATKKYVDDVTVAGSARFTVLTNVLKVSGVAGPAGATGATGPVAGVSGQLIWNNGGASAGTLVKYGSSTITNGLERLCRRLWQRPV